MTEHVCSRKYVRSTKGTLYFGKKPEFYGTGANNKVNDLSLNPWP